MKRLTSIVCACGVAAIIGHAQDGPSTAQKDAIASAASATQARVPIVAKVPNSPVVDLSGQSLGHVEHIVLSPTGSAEAAIMTAADGRLIPIPWTFVRTSGDTNGPASGPGRRLVFTVSVEQATLAKAPSFTTAQWPDMGNPAWLQTSAGFFGVAREEAVGGLGSGASVISGGATSRTKEASTNNPAASSPPAAPRSKTPAETPRPPSPAGEP